MYRFDGLMRIRAALRIGIAVALLAPLSAWPQSYPTPGRLVTIVVPFSLGTGPDILARVTAQKLGERWGTSFIVDNKPGASGNIGADLVARAAGDGHTLMMHATTFTLNAALSKQAKYDPLKTFAPIALIATGTLGFVVSANTPAQSLKELVELARAKPGELNYASSGNGTPQHLTMELFKLIARVSITHIPYKDSASATRDLAGGYVNTMIFPVHTAVPIVSSAKARVIAVFGDERNPVFPDAPTMKEAGYPEVQSHVWFALFAPGATSQDIVQKINADINTMLEQPDIKETFSKQGLVPAGGKPDRLTEMVKSDFERWKRVITDAKIRAD
jgi:tripartite-type tricarboxylate transporter receptor subunit TctC